MILIFNIGSASFRWALFDEKLNRVSGDYLEYLDFSKLEESTKNVLGTLGGPTSDEVGPRKRHPTRLWRVGHRVVHGGIEFRKPTEITDKVLAKLEALSALAPLHHPPALEVVKICRKEIPNTPNVACFDTSFYIDLPDYAKYYALPLELAERHKIFKYGFHGISHEYIAEEAAKKLKKPLEELKLITCHLGAGASICAIEDGKPIDTSMGFTPLEGLMMATRSGNLDPAIPLFLQAKGKLSQEETLELLNKKSGLLGVSGISGDVRDIIKAMKDEKEEQTKKSRAGLALQMYAYRVKKYIGAYAVSLGGLDALVFTGAVAEGSELVRNMITHGLFEVLGDFEILTIPGNEELAIARKIEKIKD